MDRVPTDFCERVAISIPQSEIADVFSRYDRSHRNQTDFDAENRQLAFNAIRGRTFEAYGLCVNLDFTADECMTIEELTRTPDFYKCRISSLDDVTAGEHDENSELVDAPLETFLNFVCYLSNEPALFIHHSMRSVSNVSTVTRLLQNVNFSSVHIWHYSEVCDNFIRHQVSQKPRRFELGSDDRPEESIAMIRDFIISGQMPFVDLKENPPFQFDVCEHIFRNVQLEQTDYDVRAALRNRQQKNFCDSDRNQIRHVSWVVKTEHSEDHLIG